MTHAALSPEKRIEDGLRSIDCTQRQFANIACSMGVPVSPSLISLALSGRRELMPWTAERLLNLVHELGALKDYLRDVPINWGASQGVATLLVLRRMEEDP